MTDTKELECKWCGNIITVVKKPYKVMSDHMSKQHTKGCPNCETVVGKSYHKPWCEELTWKKGNNLCGKCRNEINDNRELNKE